MEEWEIQERRRKILCHAVGMIVGVAVLFLLLLFVARRSGGKSQDQFTIICHRIMQGGERGSGK